MENTHQPLLGTTTSKKTATKFKVVVFVVVALLGAVAICSIFIPRNRAHLCNHAYDPSSCLAILSELPSPGLMQPSDTDILYMILAKSSSQIRETLEFTNHLYSRINDKESQVTLALCRELLDLSADGVEESMAALKSPTANSHYDVHSWLSAVLTNHFTCLDELNGTTGLLLEPRMNELVSRARTSLALVVATAPPHQPEEEMLRPPSHGRDFYPSWVSSEDRRLLEASGKDIVADLVVAQDGSGDYTTVQEGVEAAPKKSKTRFVIYVKKGIYEGQVNITKDMKYLMLVGDGVDSTIITGSLNAADGYKTFNTATVAAVGTGFIAQDICFQNTAGPEKDQAVALRVGADKSVINRCKIDAFQDTLYAHSHRQFYRDCYVTGTVDFIFGNAAVVLQNSKLVPRLPMEGQRNMVTAQGRKDANSATGTTIQFCNISASPDLEPVIASFPSYLGRPWKEYSKTVVMQSYIGDVIDPAGWYPWDEDKYLDTLYYGEYLNFGPGAGTSERVDWPGFHVIRSAKVAREFTVNKLLQGYEWLPETGVEYTGGLWF